MPTHIALLRSVNVLGKNMIKMPELAKAFEKAGFFMFVMNHEEFCSLRSQIAAS